MAKEQADLMDVYSNHILNIFLSHLKTTHFVMNIQVHEYTITK